MTHKNIDIRVSGTSGYATGIVCNESSQSFDQWFEERYSSPCLLDRSNALYCFLDEIYVPVFDRNFGFGNELMDVFLKEAESNNVSCILLECHQGENDFNLKRWYESFDFVAIDDSNCFDYNGFPLMIRLID